MATDCFWVSFKKQLKKGLPKKEELRPANIAEYTSRYNGRGVLLLQKVAHFEKLPCTPQKVAPYPNPKRPMETKSYSFLVISPTVLIMCPPLFPAYLDTQVHMAKGLDVLAFSW